MNVDETVFYLKKLVNLILNFIRHGINVCDDKDPYKINKENQKINC